MKNLLKSLLIGFIYLVISINLISDKIQSEFFSGGGNIFKVLFIIWILFLMFRYFNGFKKEENSINVSILLSGLGLVYCSIFNIATRRFHFYYSSEERITTIFQFLQIIAFGLLLFGVISVLIKIIKSNINNGITKILGKIMSIGLGLLTLLSFSIAVNMESKQNIKYQNIGLNFKNNLTNEGKLLSGLNNNSYTILVYGDIDNIFTRRLYNETLKPLISKYKEINIEFKPVLLFKESNQILAGEFECLKQNDLSKAYKYIDMIFMRKTKEKILDINGAIIGEGYGDEIDMDMIQYLKQKNNINIDWLDSCINQNSGVILDKIRRNKAEMKAEYGTDGIPTAIIKNNITNKFKVIEGAYPIEEFQKALKEVGLIESINTNQSLEIISNDNGANISTKDKPRPTTQQKEPIKDKYNPYQLNPQNTIETTKKLTEEELRIIDESIQTKIISTTGSINVGN